VIYIDSSVVLAQLLTEDRRPSDAIWQEDLVSSRLLEYEVWTRIHARGLASSGRAAIETALTQIDMYDLTPDVLDRALHPFPIPLRTLDALHLATIDFLNRRGQALALASYDQRLLTAAQALGIEAAPL
jgi:predicted nucleic acid-binding protein